MHISIDLIVLITSYEDGSSDKCIYKSFIFFIPQAGFPVANTDYLTGIKKTAIQRLTSGFPLATESPDGSCGPTAMTPVRFGYNSTSSCSLYLDRQTLGSICRQVAVTQQYICLF